MDFHRLGGTVSAKGQISSCYTDSENDQQHGISEITVFLHVGKRFISLNPCAGHLTVAASRMDFAFCRHRSARR